MSAGNLKRFVHRCISVKDYRGGGCECDCSVPSDLREILKDLKGAQAVLVALKVTSGHWISDVKCTAFVAGEVGQIWCPFKCTAPKDSTLSGK